MKTRSDGDRALGVAYLKSTLQLGPTEPVAETQAHLDDILKTYGDVANAPWKTAFGTMIGWAMLWARKDGAALEAAGVPDARVAPFRKALLGFATYSDALFGRSEWKALLANPKLLPSLCELKAAKAKGGPAYEAMRIKIWAAEHIQTPMDMAAVASFDMDTADLRYGQPGLYETYFGKGAGKALSERIDSAMKVVGSYVSEGDAVWNAMQSQRAEWAAITQKAEAKSETLAAKAYAAPQTGNASQSRTGGVTPASVAVRLTKID